MENKGIHLYNLFDFFIWTLEGGEVYVSLSPFDAPEGEILSVLCADTVVVAHEFGINSNIMKKVDFYTIDIIDLKVYKYIIDDLLEAIDPDNWSSIEGKDYRFDLAYRNLDEFVERSDSLDIMYIGNECDGFF